MSALSLAVGMGNVWRFPYMCYRNGGGAFLFPYLFMVVVAGFPIMFLEFAFGQYGATGIVTIWQKGCPLFEGIGWSITVVTFTMCIYYNMLIAYSVYFIFASFTSQLPWETCGNPWNTKCEFHERMNE
ncbi:hypothetical protein NP493_343g01015 [Ridgeia piscesae]|uniref:Transporter n=1 Tax=Ridgeia piscesae TaxID=27915 RepID=A0AAD9L4S9_RIDPI|nr:hypothetical protein NP493_343g01015 [Ridgeia piscesae]